MTGRCAGRGDQMFAVRSEGVKVRKKSTGVLRVEHRKKAYRGKTSLRPAPKGNVRQKINSARGDRSITKKTEEKGLRFGRARSRRRRGTTGGRMVVTVSLHKRVAYCSEIKWESRQK